MNDDISSLFEFFERCGPEVSGRSLGVLEPHQSSTIERFIEGQCDGVERRELAQFLQLHPAWIRWIADRVIMARDLDGAAPATGE